MFDQEKLDFLLDEDFIYSADIATKIMLGNLKEEKHGLDDWLRSLPKKKLESFHRYCEDCSYETIETLKEKNLDIRDLVSVVYLLCEMELGEEADITDSELVDKMEIVNFASSMELLRRRGSVVCLKKAFVSDADSGVYQAQEKEEKGS